MRRASANHVDLGTSDRSQPLPKPQLELIDLRATSRNWRRMATIGQAVPDGTYQAFHEDEIRTLKLESYGGRWLVIVFYPGDFTFICPTELEELGALYSDFQKARAEVIGVSTDSVYVHKAWHDTSPAIRTLAFPL